MLLKQEKLDDESPTPEDDEKSLQEIKEECFDAPEPVEISDFLPEKPKNAKVKKKVGNKKPCEYCGHVYSAYKMSLHVRVHTGDRPYKCDLCPKAFKQRGQLESHQITHTAEKRYKCDYCDKVFSFPQARNRHVKVHEGALRLTCGLCGSLCHSAEAMRKHELRHKENPPVSCEFCGKQFWSKYKYREHKEQVHVKKRFKCELCSGVYSSSSSLKRHEAVHTQREELQCEKCSFKTWYEKRMIRHKEQHLKGLLGNKLECSGCDYTTYHKEMMRKHEKLHTLDIPVLDCIHCDFHAKEDRSLRGHIMRVHGGIKNFKCEQCELTFLTQMSRLYHQKRNHKKTNHQCTVCLKYYTYSCGVRKHKCKKVVADVEESVECESDPLALNDEAAAKGEHSVVFVKVESCLGEGGANEIGDE